MASKSAAGKPALAMGTKKASGARMECPTCGFKWVRPPGEEHKPCPKCFKPLPKGLAAAAPKAAASPKKAASPTAAKAKAASPAPASPPAAAAPAEAASPAPAASSPKPVKKASTPTNAGGAAGLGSAATVGQKMECPTCGFKWNRPAGEDNKPCPKCLKPLPKSAVKGVAKVAAKSGKPSIFDKLTDPKQYIGAHKARFDSDGKGRGIAGRY